MGIGSSDLRPWCGLEESHKDSCFVSSLIFFFFSIMTSKFFTECSRGVYGMFHRVSWAAQLAQPKCGQYMGQRGEAHSGARPLLGGQHNGQRVTNNLDSYGFAH